MVRRRHSFFSSMITLTLLHPPLSPFPCALVVSSLVQRQFERVHVICSLFFSMEKRLANLSRSVFPSLYPRAIIIWFSRPSD